MTISEISYGSFEDAFLDELVAWIDGRSVLEVFAGNGLLARRLADRGIDIVATTLFAGHDGHHHGMHFPVEEMRARDAAIAYGDREVLLMSWPTADEGALMAVDAWGEARPVVFIGEVTVLSENKLGGCGSDNLFELTRETHVFGAYRPRNFLERAAVREYLPGARLELRAALSERRLPSADRIHTPADAGVSLQR